MTKKEVLKDFKVVWSYEVRNNPRLQKDKIARCESWNNYTDLLCKAGHITLKQYEGWTNPF